MKDDPRSHGGDGLGPVFNGQSCVGCHNLGGSGGAGAVDRNIELATVNGAFGDGMGYSYSFSMDFGAGRMDYRFGGDQDGPSRRRPLVDTTFLAGIHPGFRDSKSTVLHHYGTDPAYQTWRGSVTGRHGTILIQSSKRNPTALFGAGRIDSISDEVIDAAARRKSSGASQVKGRVSRLKDGRIGRFGWKAQTATLDDFVRSAAAGEMGLEVPRSDTRRRTRAPARPRRYGTRYGRRRNVMPWSSTSAELANSLSLSNRPMTKRLPSGRPVNQPSSRSAVPPATCPNWATSRESIATFSSMIWAPSSPTPTPITSSSANEQTPTVCRLRVAVRNELGTASLREWRTPPLWGVRDSGPYLHDGRAATLAEAIRLHAGQGATAARRFAELSPRRKQQLEAFLFVACFAFGESMTNAIYRMTT